MGLSWTDMKQAERGHVPERGHALALTASSDLPQSPGGVVALGSQGDGWPLVKIDLLQERDINFQS